MQSAVRMNTFDCVRTYLQKSTIPCRCVVTKENFLGPDCMCYWFSNDTTIPGKPTISSGSYLRTYQDILSNGSVIDWTASNPWRAPGTAEVYSPCGVYGGRKCFKLPIVFRCFLIFSSNSKIKRQITHQATRLAVQKVFYNWKGHVMADR